MGKEKERAIEKNMARPIYGISPHPSPPARLPARRHPPRGGPWAGGQENPGPRHRNPLFRDPPGKGREGKTAATYSPARAVPSAHAGLTALFGMGRGGTPVLWPPEIRLAWGQGEGKGPGKPGKVKRDARDKTQAPGRKRASKGIRAISRARLKASPPVHLPPIDVIVSDDPQGNLILGPASRLDAFSAYPIPA